MNSDTATPLIYRDFSKGVNPMDIVTVFIKVVREQQRQIQEQRKTDEQQQGWIKRLTQERENMVRQQRDIVFAQEGKVARLEWLLAQKGN